MDWVSLTTVSARAGSFALGWSASNCFSASSNVAHDLNYEKLASHRDLRLRDGS